MDYRCRLYRHAESGEQETHLQDHSRGDGARPGETHGVAVVQVRIDADHPRACSSADEYRHQGSVPNLQWLRKRHHASILITDQIEEHIQHLFLEQNEPNLVPPSTLSVCLHYTKGIFSKRGSGSSNTNAGSTW